MRNLRWTSFQLQCRAQWIHCASVLQRKRFLLMKMCRYLKLSVKNFGAYRAIPRRWQSWLNKHPELSHLKKPLGKFCGGYPLIVELCCELDSAIRRLCQKRCVPYIGIDRNINVKSSVFRDLMKFVLGRKGWVCVHISTPCTAGCRLRYVGHSAAATWNRRYREHKEIWKSIRNALEGVSRRPMTLLTQEWPKGTELWIERGYVKAASEVG